MESLFNARLGREIKALRRSLGLTQSWLAERAEISVRYLQEIEAGQVDLRLSVLHRLSKYLNVEMTYFLGGVDQVASRLIPQSSIYFRGFSELDIKVAITDLTGELLFAPVHLIREAGLDWQDLDQSFHLADLLHSEKDKQEFRTFLEFIVQHQPKPSCHVTRIKASSNRGEQVRLHWQYLFNKINDIRGLVFTVHKDVCPCPYL